MDWGPSIGISPACPTYGQGCQRRLGCWHGVSSSIHIGPCPPPERALSQTDPAKVLLIARHTSANLYKICSKPLRAHSLLKDASLSILLLFLSLNVNLLGDEEDSQPLLDQARRSANLCLQPSLFLFSASKAASDPRFTLDPPVSSHHPHTIAGLCTLLSHLVALDHSWRLFGLIYGEPPEDSPRNRSQLGFDLPGACFSFLSKPSRILV